MQTIEKRVTFNEVFAHLRDRRQHLMTRHDEMLSSSLGASLIAQAEIRAIDAVILHLIMSKEQDINKALSRAVKFAQKNAEKYGRSKTWKTPSDFFMSEGYTNAKLTILPLTVR